MTSEFRDEPWVPIVFSCSRTTTSRPNSARRRAAASPTTPAPITTASTSMPSSSFDGPPTYLVQRERQHHFAGAAVTAVAVDAPGSRRNSPPRSYGRVEPARDGGHSLIAKLSECRRWLIVLEDAMPGVVLVKHHPDWRIERGRQPMPRHERGRDRIADIVLESATRLANDLQQGAMVADLEDR